MDFKPSWSKTGDMLVCFRRLKDDPVTVNWKSAIFIINVDGTGFHQLSDGTHTDFNPTWTRDGLNTPIWNRKNDTTGGFHRDAEQGGRQARRRGRPHRREFSHLGALVPHGRPDSRELAAPDAGLGRFLDDPPGRRQAPLRTHSVRAEGQGPDCTGPAFLPARRRSASSS